MAEYIKKQVALDAILSEPPDAHYPSWYAERIKALPAADVVPVVHGRWTTKHYIDGIFEGTNFDECSARGYQRVFDDPALKTRYDYCPHCGGKMEGGADNE